MLLCRGSLMDQAPVYGTGSCGFESCPRCQARGLVAAPLTKKCSRCGQWRHVSEYTKNLTRKDGLNSACRPCHKKWQGQHYRKNKVYYAAKARRQAKMLASVVQAAKKDVPCADCGVVYPPYVMDFDHRDPKQKFCMVSQVWRLCSPRRVREEIAKCDVVCANCHRERTHQRGYPNSPPPSAKSE